MAARSRTTRHLGSGNHFLAVGYVAEIYDTEAARVLGLQLDEITVIIHCGSRGVGYQVCDDYLGVMDSAVKKYHIALSRVKARQAAVGRNIIREMEKKGIIVRGQSRRTVDEEISEAYKDVSNVVDACALAGISRKVAQLRPIGCIKG